MRLTLSSMGLIAATYGLARFGYGLFLPQFQQAFDLDGATAGMIQAGSFLSYCVAAVIAALGAKWPRLLVVCAGASASAGALTVATAPSTAVLGIGVVVAGTGAGFATPGTVGLISRIIGEAKREGAQTTVNSGTGVGLVAAGLLLATTTENWRTGWTIIAITTALATVATLTSARAGHPHHTSRFGEPAADAHVRPHDLLALRRVVAIALCSGAGSAAVWTFGRSALDAASPSFFTGQSYSVTAWILLGAMSVAGALAARLVQRWSLSRAWSLTNLAMLVGTAGVGVDPGHPVIAFAAVSLFGASYTAMTGVLIVWAMRLTPRSAAAGTVVLFVALALGQAVGAWLLGALQDFSSAPVMFFAAATIGAVAIAGQPRPVPANRTPPDRRAVHGAR